MATITRIGYGQVEPNHLSAQRTAQIYAQLPATGMTVLENGQYVKYDLAAGKVDLTGSGEWMLVYNEIKLYDERKQMYKDFALLAADAVDGEIVPRVFKTNIGDIYTTNMVAEEDLAVGDTLAPATDGILAKASEGDMLWQVAAITTLADGQAAVKIQRIK